MKNIEWLKEQVNDYLDIEGVEDARMALKAVLGYIDQLDEAEVLSEEWIERNTSPVDDEGRLFVWKSDLQNAIVPKQEEVDRAYKDGYEKGKQHTFYKGYLEGLADKESETETVADVIADFWKSFERLKEVLGTKVEELEE